MTESGQQTEVDFLAEIRSAIGVREIKPTTLWYISDELVDQVPFSLVENITSSPSMIVDVCRLQSGGLLIMVMAARADQDMIEEMFRGLGSLYKITPSEVV